MSTQDQHLTVRLSSTLYDKVRQRAAEQDRTVGYVVRKALELAMADTVSKPPSAPVSSETRSESPGEASSPMHVDYVESQEAPEFIKPPEIPEDLLKKPAGFAPVDRANWRR